MSIKRETTLFILPFLQFSIRTTLANQCGVGRHCNPSFGSPPPLELKFCQLTECRQSTQTQTKQTNQTYMIVDYP